MNRVWATTCGCLWVIGCATTSPQAQSVAPATAEQREAFGVLAELPGKTFRGVFGEDEGGVDIQRWDWALGGSALRITHALADGSYGGESFVYQDAKTGELAFVYVTNGGFHTSGQFVVNDDGSWTAIENVQGHPEITQVRSTGRLNADGSLQSISEYMKNGEWVAGRTASYKPSELALPTLAPRPNQ